MNASRFFRHTRRNVATFCLSDLVNLKDVHSSTTAGAFSGCNLSVIKPQIRGHILEDVGRTIYQRHHPNSQITDPVPGYKCNGTRRSLNQAEFDWMCDETRVQCKSSQICLDQATNTWHCRFTNIKPNLLDQLFLVLYTPNKLFFVCHDGGSGLTSNGGRTTSSGYRLYYCAAAGITCHQLATSCILERMEQQSCRILDSICTSSQVVVDKLNSVLCTPKQQLERSAFMHHPFGDINPSRRGLIIQDIVQQIDESHHHIATSSVPGGSRFDWRRQDLRFECKHSRMAWSSMDSWYCRFSGVKPDCFDVLYLALDTPAGIHVLKVHGSKFLNSDGLAEKCTGKDMKVNGPKNEKRWSVALDDIMNKLIRSGSQHIATVKW